MYLQKISPHQARMFLVASIIIAFVAIVMGVASDSYRYYYGVLSALSAGLSVGTGFLFSDGIFYITDKGGTVKILIFGLLSVIFIATIIIVFPLNQYKFDGIYYLNLTGQIVVVPSAFSIAAFIHTIFLRILNSKKSRIRADQTSY